MDVKSAVSGKVVSIFHRDGDQVKRGDVLARVEPDLNQAQSLAETKKERSSLEQKVGLAEVEAHYDKTVRRAETAHANADGRERDRAFYLGVWGLCLVTAGALMQTAAAVLAATRPAD